MAPIPYIPKMFPKFSSLPPELRNQIWWNALPAEDGPALFFYRKGCWCPLGQDPEYPDLIIFEFCDNLLDRVHVEMALAHVNQEARSIALSWAQQQGFKMLSYKQKKCPIFARSFDSTRDALYISEAEWGSFDREPYDRLSEPDLMNHTVTTTSYLNRLAVPEALFWSEIENLADMFDWYCNIALLFIVIDTPPEPQFNIKDKPPPPRWELEAIQEARFVWDCEKCEFGFDGHHLGDKVLQRRMEEALRVLADGLVKHRVRVFEVQPVLAANG